MIFIIFLDIRYYIIYIKFSLFCIYDVRVWAWVCHDTSVQSEDDCWVGSLLPHWAPVGSPGSVLVARTFTWSHLTGLGCLNVYKLFAHMYVCGHTCTYKCTVLGESEEGIGSPRPRVIQLWATVSCWKLKSSWCSWPLSHCSSPWLFIF